MLLMASLVFFLIAVGIRDTFFSIPAEDVLRNFRELPEDRKGGKNLRKDNDLNSDKDLEEAGDFPCVLDYWKREEKTKYDERQRMIQIKNQSIRERLGKPHQERVEICAVELSDVRSADKDGSDHDSCHNSVLKDADKLVWVLEFWVRTKVVTMLKINSASLPQVCQALQVSPNLSTVLGVGLKFGRRFSHETYLIHIDYLDCSINLCFLCIVNLLL